jgi:hypothetical protein
VTAYIDTSALLRIVLREAGALDDLRSYDGLVSSELIVVESMRTIDRLRLRDLSPLKRLPADCGSSTIGSKRVIWC